MMADDQPVTGKNNSASSELLKVSTVAYLVMAIVGFEICWWYHQNVRALMGPLTYDPLTAGGIVLAAVAFLLLCQRLMEDFFPSYVTFKNRLSQMFGNVGWSGAIWLALISAFSEEILFRGAIQPFLGIWFTSIVFGILHLDPDGGLSAWTFWAVLAGLLLGSVVQVTGSLWPAIAIHFIVNLIGIRSLARLKDASQSKKSSMPPGAGDA